LFAAAAMVLSLVFAPFAYQAFRLAILALDGGITLEPFSQYVVLSLEVGAASCSAALTVPQQCRRAAGTTLLQGVVVKCGSLTAFCLLPRQAPAWNNPAHPWTIAANVVWAILFGWQLFLAHLAAALFQAATIIGIGTALTNVQLAFFAL
jgi:uncharacterized membrane protein YccF (DUF307 family)